MEAGALPTSWGCLYYFAYSSSQGAYTANNLHPGSLWNWRSPLWDFAWYSAFPDFLASLVLIPAYYLIFLGGVTFNITFQWKHMPGLVILKESYAKSLQRWGSKLMSAGWGGGQQLVFHTPGGMSMALYALPSIRGTPLRHIHHSTVHQFLGMSVYLCSAENTVSIKTPTCLWVLTVIRWAGWYLGWIDARLDLLWEIVSKKGGMRQGVEKPQKQLPMAKVSIPFASQREPGVSQRHVWLVWTERRLWDSLLTVFHWSWTCSRHFCVCSSHRF
jgi:hypothetical protein